MLRKFSEKLFDQLNEDLKIVSSNEHELLKRMTASVSKVRKALQVLKERVEQHPFPNPAEEIHFFKYIKPKFYARQIYEVQLYKIENSKPCGTFEVLKRYYEDELIFINRFFKQNQFLYEYYRNGMTELDTLYFVRGIEVQMVLFPDIPELQPEFSTSCDYQFSKFIAYELISKELLSKIRAYTNDPVCLSEEPAGEKQMLVWTGDKTNLVEVIYGLFYTGQLNNGNANVADIIKMMEESFQIDLSRAYRNFLDIRSRKRDSPTRYLDKMRESIQQRVDEDNTYKPNRGIKLRGNEEE
jgi:hypothetical protein